jgi:FdhE protein
MTSPSFRTLRSPEEIAVRAGGQVPFVRLPERSTAFAEREMRLRQRAAAHPMRDFLLFMAEVSACQHLVLTDYPEVALPDGPALAAASRVGAPPLPATLWPRDPAWLTETNRLLDALIVRLADSPASETAVRLRSAEPRWVEQQADRLLAGVMLGLDIATAPLIAAGLQVYFTHLVVATGQAHGPDRLAPFGRVDDATACPCCASLPTASVSRIGGDASGYRYLHCSLCSAQWHMVRIKCTHCLSTKGIHYQSPQPLNATSTDAKQAVGAETCDECGHYLKIVHMDRDAHVEPVADDLASVTLDLLVSEAGFDRHGINLMLLFGDADQAPPDGGGG